MGADPTPVAPARPAATVVVLRADDAGRPELLLLQRARNLGFFPRAWVFPGGRVDAGDVRVPVRGRVEGLPDQDTAFAVAAVRECFEETGVWLGEGAPPDALRAALIAREATLDGIPDLVADLRGLHLWSWWVTPDNEPRRYDTRFFLTVLPPGARPHVEPDGHETVAAAWLRPADALERAHVDDLFFAPPTWHTLVELAAHDRVDDVLAEARRRRPRPVQPVLHQQLPDGDGWGVLLPGDPGHPEPGPGGGPTRIVLDQGRWRHAGG